MAYRFATVIAILVSAYAFLLFHLFQLQLVKTSFYAAQADSEAASLANANANRGAIYFTDENGNLLPAAVDQEFSNHLCRAERDNRSGNCCRNRRTDFKHVGFDTR